MFILSVHVYCLKSVKISSSNLFCLIWKFCLLFIYLRKRFLYHYDNVWKITIIHFSIYYRLILDKNSELWNLLEALKHYFVDSVGYEFRGKHLSATKGELKIKFTVQDSTSSVFTNDIDESYNLQITSSNESVSA